MMYPMNAGIISGAMVVVLILVLGNLGKTQLIEIAQTRKRQRELADSLVQDPPSPYDKVMAGLPPDIQAGIRGLVSESQRPQSKCRHQWGPDQSYEIEQ